MVPLTLYVKSGQPVKPGTVTDPETLHVLGNGGLMFDDTLQTAPLVSDHVPEQCAQGTVFTEHGGY